jgi:hypothetical protein
MEMLGLQIFIEQRTIRTHFGELESAQPRGDERLVAYTCSTLRALSSLLHDEARG